MKERIWFITGISSGFGRLMAEHLLSRGEHVAGTIRKAGVVDDLMARYGDRLWTAQLDMIDVAGIRAVVNHAFAELGRIDVLVSNAGYGLFGAAEELSDEQIDHQIATNLVGPIQLVRAVVPHLRAQGSGRIIQISTYGGLAAMAGGSLYHASKWGGEGFFEAMMHELAPFNIGVTIVEPGGARTEFRFGSAQVGTKIDAYQGTPAGMVHSVLQDRSRQPIGDPAKMVEVIVASVDRSPPPKRIVLGSDSYAAIMKAIGDRLADIEGQKEAAFSTDCPPAA